MTMKKYIILIAVLALTGPVAAQQPIDAVLQQIERNNTTLEALRKQTEADKLQNKTGITLPDPEVSFDYLWGDPSATARISGSRRVSTSPPSPVRAAAWPMRRTDCSMSSTVPGAWPSCSKPSRRASN